MTIEKLVEILRKNDGLPRLGTVDSQEFCKGTIAQRNEALTIFFRERNEQEEQIRSVQDESGMSGLDDMDLSGDDDGRINEELLND